MELRPFVAQGKYFESPRWHDGSLWCVDALARSLLRIADDGRAEIVCSFEGVPSGFAFTPRGQALVVSMFDRRLFRVEGGRPVLHSDLSKASAGTLDDMIIDGAGRIYVGDLGMDLTAGGGDMSAPVGRILLVAPDGSARVVADGLRFPNGIAVSADGRELVVAESEGDCLARYEIHDDGSLAFKDRIGHFGEPDGICLDSEGAVWVSLFKEDSFVRIDRTGAITDRIKTPNGRAIACATGSAGRRTLFCISAETTHEDLMAGRSTARIDTAEIKIPGAGFP